MKKRELANEMGASMDIENPRPLFGPAIYTLSREGLTDENAQVRYATRKAILDLHHRYGAAIDDTLSTILENRVEEWTVGPPMINPNHLGWASTRLEQ